MRTKRLAVTGCSYAGKMALWAGAFDERIALTIPQESAGGGEASWRVMAGQPATENLEEAQGTGWYSEAGGTSMKAAAEVYEALGVPDRIGFSQAAASGHCVFRSSQSADVMRSWNGCSSTTKASIRAS